MLLTGSQTNCVGESPTHSVSPRAPVSEGSKPSPVFRPPTSSSPIKNKTPTIQKQASRRQQGVTNLVANFQSVKNKIPTLSTTITVDNPNIIYGTETWLHEQIHDSELLLGGFTIYRNDLSGDNNSKEGGGGVLLAIRNSLASELVFMSPSIESIFCRINNKNKPRAIVGCVYRPPDNNNEICNTICNEILKLKTKFKKSIFWVGGRLQPSGHRLGNFRN